MDSLVHWLGSARRGLLLSCIFRHLGFRVFRFLPFRSLLGSVVCHIPACTFQVEAALGDEFPHLPFAPLTFCTALIGYSLPNLCLMTTLCAFILVDRHKTSPQLSTLNHFADPMGLVGVKDVIQLGQGEILQNLISQRMYDSLFFFPVSCQDFKPL